MKDYQVVNNRIEFRMYHDLSIWLREMHEQLVPSNYLMANLDHYVLLRIVRVDRR